MTAWVLTYLLHSTLLFLAAWALGRLPWGRAPRAGDAIWKCAMGGALVTATIHQAIGGTTSVALPIAVDAPGAAGMPGPAGGSMPWLALAWAAASSLAAARLAWGWIRLRRAAGRRRVISRGPLRRELDVILETAGVRRRVTLSCSRGLTVPRAIGTREICVPIRALRDLSPAEQRALLAHEAAHLLRHDGVWLFVAVLLQTFAWWQPLTRLAVARLRHSMELCCDDWAASVLPDRMALAECLVKVGEWGVQVPRDVPLAALAVHGSALRERVERLIDSAAPDARAPRRPWLAAAPLLVVLALAPRLTLAEMVPIPSLTAVVTSVTVAPPVTSAPEPDRRPAAPPLARASRQTPVAAPVQPRELVDVAAPLDVTRSSESVPAPAAEGVSIITMPEPLLRPAPSLRAASTAARIVPPAAAPPLVGKADLDRRVAGWLLYQNRTPSFDPLRPNYSRQ